MLKKKKKIIKNMQVQGMLTPLFFNKDQQNIILGLCLGGIKIKKVKNNYILDIKRKNKEYIFNMFNIFNDYIIEKPKEIIIKNKSSNWFIRISSNELRSYIDLFNFSGSYKIPNNIKNLLNPAVLTHWFMTHDFTNKKFYSFGIWKFNIDDFNILNDIIHNLYNVKFQIIKNQVIVNIESVINFKEFIQYEMFSCMSYKLTSLSSSYVIKNLDLNEKLKIELN